jgi:hypothetical protein
MSHEDLHWTRSRRCNSGHCVEVAVSGDHVMIRDSSDPEGRRLAFSRAAWSLFVEGLKADEFTSE